MIYTADIEACQRNPAIWGPNATKFMPTRWTTITKEYENNFFPFGKKPFVCPVKAVFGPQMVGLLVGALVKSFGQGWHLECPNIMVGMYLGRTGFDEIVLARDSEFGSGS